LPGRILSVSVAVGDVIQQGYLVCVIESMKMENPILAPTGGKVTEVKIEKGKTVKGGEIIVVLEG